MRITTVSHALRKSNFWTVKYSYNAVLKEIAARQFQIISQVSFVYFYFS